MRQNYQGALIEKDILQLSNELSITITLVFLMLFIVFVVTQMEICAESLSKSFSIEGAGAEMKFKTIG